MVDYGFAIAFSLRQAARDGGKVHTVVQGGGHAEQATDFLPTEESWEPVGGLSAHEVEALPSAFQNV